MTVENQWSLFFWFFIQFDTITFDETDKKEGEVLQLIVTPDSAKPNMDFGWSESAAMVLSSPEPVYMMSDLFHTQFLLWLSFKNRSYALETIRKASSLNGHAEIKDSRVQKGPT